MLNCPLRWRVSCDAPRSRAGATCIEDVLCALPAAHAVGRPHAASIEVGAWMCIVLRPLIGAKPSRHCFAQI